MLKKLSDNLNMLMAEARLNSSELARQTGIPAGTIKRIKNNNANPTMETLLPIAQYFSVAISELIGDAHLNTPITIGLKKIPLLTWRACMLNEQTERSHCSQYILSERQISKRGFALQVEKDDIGFFPKNSLLIVEPEKTPESGDYVIVSKAGQGIASIRKYICDINQIYLKPLVMGIETTPMTDELNILGVIIQYKVELSSETN